METRTVKVLEVMSPGTIRADDGLVYVLRGIPDTEETGNLAAARELVEKTLLNQEILINEETARELPDLPGTEVDAFDTDCHALTPRLAARVAGALVNHPLS